MPLTPAHTLTGLTRDRAPQPVVTTTPVRKRPTTLSPSKSTSRPSSSTKKRQSTTKGPKTPRSVPSATVSAPFTRPDPPKKVAQKSIATPAASPRTEAPKRVPSPQEDDEDHIVLAGSASAKKRSVGSAVEREGERLEGDSPSRGMKPRGTVLGLVKKAGPVQSPRTGPFVVTSTRGSQRERDIVGRQKDAEDDTASPRKQGKQRAVDDYSAREDAGTGEEVDGRRRHLGRRRSSSFERDGRTLRQGETSLYRITSPTQAPSLPSPSASAASVSLRPVSPKAILRSSSPSISTSVPRTVTLLAGNPQKSWTGDGSKDISQFLASLTPNLSFLYPHFDQLGCTSSVDLVALASEEGLRRKLLDMVDRQLKEVQGVGLSWWERLVLEEGIAGRLK